MNNLLKNGKKVFNEYPRAFWTYNVVVFIDRLGGFMLYPFFALYLTQKFDLSMSTVGILFAIFSVSGFVGSAIGGAITDRMGRKGVIIASLVLSSLSALGMGFAPTLEFFVVVTVVVGTLSSIGGPAHEAVVADLLPEEKRAEGYGIIRVVFNLAVIIAPPIAGLLIANSYLTLFIVDAVISLIAAAIVLLALPETKPQGDPNAKPETMKQTFKGYGRVFRDTPFVLFIGVTILMTLVYMNMNSTLGVFLRDYRGLAEIGYGSLLSINAVIVVALQFWLTRRLEKYKPLLMMAVGSFLYAIGFAMYGIVGGFPLFVTAMIVITIGEMVVSPFQQSLVASFAPEDMRGRYMAVSGLTWGISFAIGPYFAGLLLDSANPNMLWFVSGFIGLLATFGFIALNKFHHPALSAVESVAAN
ncbi:MAG: MFS transporter [Anaerolineae bacterium]|jgi:MFS family permease|nr:MFS transporter [Anaerolineae bacterium]MBT4310266.1 MFS transporter [Anaerolineae bacterium]MBT4460259.1 MFS transporter [Anaerolineae bacterium]MBT6059639.1 MFS transporter [Anaerolineae bacterium]MBT6324196.1 MFS transporter [Anaerolineae bacterium]